MNANKFAQQIRKAGIPVLSVTEGDDVQDGCVSISEAVHIQVPTVGRLVAIVVENAAAETFEFYPERRATDLNSIVADIRNAQGDIGRASWRAFYKGE